MTLTFAAPPFALADQAADRAGDPILAQQQPAPPPARSNCEKSPEGIS